MWDDSSIWWGEGIALLNTRVDEVLHFAIDSLKEAALCENIRKFHLPLLFKFIFLEKVQHHGLVLNSLNAGG